MVYAILTYIVLQRLTEIWIAQRNTKKLISQGAREFFPGHYPLFFLVHGGWLLTLFLSVNSFTQVNGYFLLAFVFVQIFRYWILWSLGSRWTTRIIQNQEWGLVSDGPYKWIKHPNYLVVVMEIALVPMIFNLPIIAGFFSLFNFILLDYRIRLENRVLYAKF